MKNPLTRYNRFKAGVYMITCNANGKRYVGSTRTKFCERFSCHKNRLKRRKHSNRKMLACAKKYGIGSFEFSVIEECEPQKAYEREQHWINELKPELNIYNDVSFVPVVKPHANLTKWYNEKINEIVLIIAKIGLLKQLAEWKEPVRMFFGFPRPAKISEESRQRRRGPRGNNSAKGRPKSEEWKRKASDSRYRYVERMKEAGMWPPDFYKNRKPSLLY